MGPQRPYKMAAVLGRAVRCLLLAMAWGGRFASVDLLATLPLPEAGTELALARTAALQPHSGTSALPPRACFQLLHEAEANAHRSIKG